MSRRIRPSESQINAEALARRGAPYGQEHTVSVSTSWDYRTRIPTDLREAVRMARKAYADEVPDKLHDGPNAIGEDGTPRMAARAVGYIFGSPKASDATYDAETGQAQDIISYYHAPFRATLAVMESHRDEATRKRAAIVSHITIGSQGPQEAAIAEGVPEWCAKLVAMDALRSFLRDLSDVRVHHPHNIPVSESTTAA